MSENPKGILLETLGDQPFLVAVRIIGIFNFFYTAYAAFIGTTVGHVDRIEGGCYCSSGDKHFYRFLTFTFIAIWLFYLVYFYAKTICHYKHFTYHHQSKAKLLEKYTDTIEDIKKRKAIRKEQLEELVNGTYLNIKHFKSIKNHMQQSDEIPSSQRQHRANSLPEQQAEEESCDNSVAKSHWRIFMILKPVLISIRSIFRFLIVPLLLLQWLNDYAWNCVTNGWFRSYCSSITNEYYRVLDHSLVVYCVYVILLAAILLSALIRWFPKGIPQVIVQYESNKCSIIKINFGFGHSESILYQIRQMETEL